MSRCDGESVVLQVDFFENATIASQREIQSAHWSHSQATIFTAHIWVKDKSKESIVIVSDNLDHSKQSIIICLHAVHLKLKCPHIKILDVFSDGAGSQFKQKYLFSNLYSWEKEHELSIHWNFFATSHGRGVVDGIARTVKRAVWHFSYFLIKNGRMW